MNVLNPKSWGTALTALGAGLIATVAMLPQAKGELVYENANGAAAPSAAAAANAQVEDRSAMRQALGASERAQATLQSQGQSQAPTPVFVAPAEALAPVAPPLVPSGPTVVETENMSKAELMRRERQREELKNEDILQERLEELRLRDERRRTDQVLNAGMAPGAPVAAVTPASMNATTALKEEFVTAPVTDHAGKPSLAPLMVPQNTAAPIAADGMQTSSMSVAPGVDGVLDRSERTRYSVTPSAGISNITNGGGYFDVVPKFAGGLGASMEAGDYISVEGGWLYNLYGVSMASGSPFVNWAQQQAAYTGQSNFQSLSMNQNVLSLGAKVHLLGPDSRIRPFLGAGGAYSWGNVNYTQQVQQLMTQYYGPQANVGSSYGMSSFLGYLSGGADLKVSRNVSVGGEFRYYNAFSSSSSSTNSPFSNGYGVYGASVSGLNSDPAVAGNSLSGCGFYSVLGNVTFTF